jgi:hypothetical protein
LKIEHVKLESVHSVDKEGKLVDKKQVGSKSKDTRKFSLSTLSSGPTTFLPLGFKRTHCILLQNALFILYWFKELSIISSKRILSQCQKFTHLSQAQVFLYPA